MITDALISILTAPLLLLLNALPVISITIPDYVFTTFTDICSLCAYILPIDTILAVLSIRIGILSFKFIWNSIQAIKGFIPFMGGN